jgi:hypothetical protein
VIEAMDASTQSILHLQQRQRLLHREQQSLYVHVELLVEVLYRNLAIGSNAPDPAFAKTVSSLPFCFLTVAYSLSRSTNFKTSP